MTGNARTRYTNVYQRRHAAQGLCRACKNPLAPSSRWYCADHLEKNRRRDSKRRNPKMALADRRRRQAEIAEWAVAHPDSKLREIAAAFSVSLGCVSLAFEKRGVRRRWRWVRMHDES